jgi:GNAT superfamily N-acetyltransferase
MVAPEEVIARALGKSDWPHVERLFGTKGACGGCWCMLWRSPYGGKRFDADKGEPNRLAFRALVESGGARGVLAFAGDEPVGWLSFGPKSDFPYFERSRVLRAEQNDAAWAVTCVYLPAKWRGRGVATVLLEAAVELARNAGAPALEGYPVVPKGQGKVPAAFAWTGVPALFEAVGFRADDSGPRVVYRRVLRT